MSKGGKIFGLMLVAFIGGFLSMVMLMYGSMSDFSYETFSFSLYFIMAGYYWYYALIPAVLVGMVASNVIKEETEGN